MNKNKAPQVPVPQTPRPMQQIDMRAREAAMFELVGRKEFENAVLKGEVQRLQGVAQQLQTQLSVKEEADKKNKTDEAKTDEAKTEVTSEVTPVS